MKHWIIMWCLSVVLILLCLNAFATNQAMKVVYLIEVVTAGSIGGYAVSRMTKRRPASKASSIFVYRGKGKERRIHFRPMEQRPEFGLKELKEFRKSVMEFQQHGVKRVVAETVIEPRIMESIGFRKVGISSPLTHLVTVLVTRFRTGHLTNKEKHWCRVYLLDVDKYLEELNKKGRVKDETC